MRRNICSYQQRLETDFDHIQVRFKMNLSQAVEALACLEGFVYDDLETLAVAIDYLEFAKRKHFNMVNTAGKLGVFDDR